MSNLVEPFSPQGMLHKGWTSKVLDYAIVCDWANKGNSLIVGDASGGLFAFEGFSGRTIWKNENIHNGGLLAMSISPDGNVIATSGQDGNVCFWDSNDGAEINILDLGKGWIEHLEWSPNGDFLAVAFSRNVLIFNPKGEEVWQSEDHSSTVSAIRWSKINEIATACYGKVTFFDCINNKINQQLQWQGSLVSMELSPNGDIVACGSQDNSVHFWRRSTGVDAEMTGYPGKPSSLSFDHTGTLLATGGSERVTVWSFHGNGPEGTRPGELGHHTQPISTLSFSNNGTLLASGSRDGSVVISFLKNNGDGDPVGAAFAGNSVSSISWKPDDCALAAVNSEGIVNLWNFRVRSDLKYKGFD